VGAFQLAEATAAGWRDASPRRRNLGLGAAAVLLLAAVLIYPPALMLYAVALAIWVLRPGGLPAEETRRAVLLSTGMAIGLVMAAASYVICLETAGRFVPLRPPPLGAQVGHFGGPLVDALGLWRIWHSPGAAAGVAIFLLGGLWAALPGPPARRALWLVLLVLAVPVAFLPNVFTVEGWGAYRSQIALSPLLIVYAFVALAGWCSLSRHRLREAAWTGVVVALALGAGVSGARNLVKYYASPQMTELRVFKSQLARIDMTKVKRVWIAGTPRDAGLTHVRYDEFGTPSSSVPGAEGPMLWVVSREILGHPPGFRIQVAPKPFRTKPNEYLVNMTQLYIFR
jgi:hypothetical protein